MSEQVLTLSIEALAYGGDSVGHTGGRVIFVPDGVPGDEVRVEVVEDKGSFLRGRLLDITAPSNDRVEPFCPYAVRCGGCQWQHVDYHAQCTWKEAIVRESLSRLGGIPDPPVESCLPAPSVTAYRSIARYPARAQGSELIWGYFEHRSHALVNIDRCPVATGTVNDLSVYIRSFFHGKEHIPDLAEITIRTSENIPSALVTISTGGSFDFSLLARRMFADFRYLEGLIIRRERGIQLPRHVRTFGAGHRTERIAGSKFRISELSFFQVNVAQTERLVALVGDMLDLQSGETVVDGYGGVGLFSLSLCTEAATVHLFDSSRSAVSDCLSNAEKRGMTMFSASCEPADRAFGRIGRADVLIIDPPRTGLGKKTALTACGLGARKVLYVSCNPSTLARDLAVFLGNGYRLERVVPVDMFPHTYHIETAAKLVKK